MDPTVLVRRRIKKYEPKGGLEGTAGFLLAMMDIKHVGVRKHMERVALLCEATAGALGKDPKAAFFGGLFHDTGKLVLPHQLFDGHNITPEEYAEIKERTKAGYRALRGQHAFVALCAGLHHAMYKMGYGLETGNFPRSWSPATLLKVLEISTIISICDFIDAYEHRSTKIMDGSRKDDGLPVLLVRKFPEHRSFVEAALTCYKQMPEVQAQSKAA